MWIRRVTACLLVGCCLGVSPMWGQTEQADPSSGLGLFGQPSADDPQLQVTAQYRLSADGTAGDLRITARFAKGWYIYSVTQQRGGPMRTTIELDAAADSQLAGSFQPDQAPKTKTVKFFKVPIEEHHDPVTWMAPFVLRPGANPQALRIFGKLSAQVCNERGGCIPVSTPFEAQRVPGEPEAVGVVGVVDPAASPVPRRTPPVDQIDSRDRPAAAVPPAAPQGNSAVTFDPSRIQVDQNREQSIGWILMLAFVGGFMLNFMPCVLPVIGLKIMSFVQQAGQDRRRVFLLNVWYTLGMLSIFWLLATLASATRLGWGEQYNYDGFTIPLLCVVFTMGLSFLGVWEIPIPGLAGSGRASELAQQEGASGAFFKGIITTILATPCTGPGLATAVTWSASKPPHLVYLVFTCMGLGMALPYLVIGAFPSLVRMIPKPGAWMDTFKQLMGFVLMGTVVYMFTMLQPERVIPTLALIFALWAGCWWIGRTEVTAGLGAKLRAWGLAALFVSLIGWFAFGYQPDREHELPWQPYSLATLDEYAKSDHTVLVDFTADW